jgi:hypothetical protein
MNITDYQNMFRKILPPEVVFAGLYLEARDYRFGIDYGTTNAISKAAVLVLKSLELDEGYGYGI